MNLLEILKKESIISSNLATRQVLYSQPVTIPHEIKELILLRTINQYSLSDNIQNDYKNK